MNELELLRTLDDDAHLPRLDELGPAKARLMGAIAAESRRPSRLALVWPRRGWLGVAGVGLASAATLAIVLMIANRHPAPSKPAPTRSAQAPLPAIAHPTATAVLVRAAFVALRTESPAPRPDQFVYTRTEAAPGGRVTQSWLSVDGTRNSRVASRTVYGCANGRLTVPASQSRFGRACTPVRAYFPDMPTAKGAIGSYLVRSQGVRRGDLNDLAKTVGSMLDSDYLTAHQQAALFRYLAGTRGLRLEPHVTDVAGRSGIGIYWTADGAKAMLIFDARTFHYLGTTTSGLQGEVSGDALLSSAIVDAAGEQPAPVNSLGA